MTLHPRAFGRTGLQLPPLVFGATSLGNLFRFVENSEKQAIVEAWANSGLSPFVIDSAGKYGAGMSLEVIGRELARLQVPPENVVISNKLGWRRVPLQGDAPTFEPDAWFGLEYDAVQDISYDGILRCWQEGNELLGDYSADLVSVHDPDEYLAASRNAEDRAKRLQDLIDAYRALIELREQGRVSAVGVGAKNWEAIEELSQHCDFDWVMFANSFTIMNHPPELCDFMDQLASKQIAIINSAVFHGGFLLGGELFDYRKLTDSPDDRERQNWRQEFQTVCKQFDVTAFDVGVAFGIAHPAITAIALSSSRGDRVPSHIAALQSHLPEGIWTELKSRNLIRSDLDFL